MKKIKNNRKKALIYTTDAVLALLLSILIILSVQGYFARLGFNKMIISQPHEAGADLMEIFNHEGYLEQFYKQNEQFFNNTVMDKSSNQNDGTYHGNATLKTNDHYNHWLELDGYGDYVNLGDVDDFDLGPNQDLTITGWIKVELFDSNLRDIYDKRDYDSVNYSGLLISVKKGSTNNIFWSKIYKKEESNGVIVSGGNLDNNWHHFAVVIDRDNNMICYIDNASIGSKDISSFSSTDLSGTTNAIIGYKTSVSSSTTYFNGLMDNIYIYNRALSESEIEKLYNNESVTYGRIAAYDFDVRSSYIDDKKIKYLPSQYDAVIELSDENTTIRSLPLPEITTALNYMPAITGVGVASNNTQSYKQFRTRIYTYVE